MNENGIVIIGAGHAGVQAAASLREAGFAGPLKLVDNENEHPYHKPPLSKAYMTGAAAEAQPLRAGVFFEKNGIERLCGTAVSAIDPAGQFITLADGRVLPFGHLILATGSVARRLNVPGGDLAGIHQLRTRADAQALRDAFADARRAVIIGAGFIGLEFAAVAAARGVETTVIEASDAILKRALSRPMAEYLHERHRAEGVTFRFQETVESFIPAEDGRVDAVRTASGDEIPADIVLVGIGADAATDLARQAGLEVGNGISVDDRLQTSAETISAIGDCVSFPHPQAETPIRLESVQNATDQARYLARTLTGSPASYDAVPWFWSDQGPLKLQIAGLSQGHDRTVLRGDMASGRFSVFCFRNDDLVAAESINQAADHMAMRRILKGDRRPSPSQIADPEFSLKAFTA